MGKSKAQVAKEEAAKEAAKLEFLEAQSGVGFEGIGAEDFQIPFLRILQPLSPQVDEDADEYVSGAKSGMFANTVNNRLYGTTINVIPLMYKKIWLEWAPHRGGLVGRHEPGSIPVNKDKFSSWKAVSDSEEPNDIAEHHVFYVIAAEHPEEGPMVFSLWSSGIKHARNWNTQIMMTKLPSGNRAPFFSSVWKLETVRNKNDAGIWYQIGERKSMIERVRFITQEEYSQIVAPTRDALKSLQDPDYAQLGDQTSEENPSPEGGENKAPF